MRVVALEEHFTVPDLVQRIDPNAISRRGFRSRRPPASGPNPVELLPEIGERRLQSMDAAGITMQVLSNSGPGPDLVPGPDGIGIARAMNDHLAAVIARHPERFAGFAVLPMQDAEAAIAEFVRAVRDLRFVGALINGTTEGRFLDHPSYDAMSIRTLRPNQFEMPISLICHRAPAACSKAPDGAGIRRRRFTYCALCFPARSIGIRDSNSS